MSLEIFALFLCLLLSGFFSASEVAFFSLRRVRLREIQKQRNHYARALVRLKKDPDRFIITVLVGNNLVNVVATVLATHLFMVAFGAKGLVYATAVMTILVLIFGEILPKEFAAEHAELFIYHTAPYFLALSVIFYPIIFSLKVFTEGILYVLGAKKRHN
jgi:putative hemolysin